MGTWQLLAMVAGSTALAGGALLVMAAIWPADLDRGTQWQDWGIGILDEPTVVLPDPAACTQRRRQAGWYPGPKPGYL